VQLLVVLYLEVDGWRIPWGFRVWRGEDLLMEIEQRSALLRSCGIEVSVD
jgi:hypothetical protein